MSFEEILYEKSDGVAVVTINRPHRLNALTPRTRAELTQAFQDAERDDAVGAVIFTGAGERAFSAGQDLNVTRQFSGGGDALTWMGQSEAIVEAMRSVFKPMVAAIHGYCVGASFQLALLTDLRLGTPETKFGMTEVNVGIPCVKGIWYLEQTIGFSRAKDLILTGRMVPAEEALAISLLHRIVPTAALMAEAMATARNLAEKPRVAVRLNKERWKELTEPGLRDSEVAGRLYHSRAFESGDPQKQMTRFFEERAARGAKTGAPS